MRRSAGPPPDPRRADCAARPNARHVDDRGRAPDRSRPAARGLAGPGGEPLMERIGDEVRRELARFGPSAGMTEIVAAWLEAVGEAIAQNAWPARIGRDGTLYAHAADAIWAFELGQRAQEIAERVGVERIRFVPGPLPVASEEPVAGRPAPPKPGPEHLARAVSLAAGIEDEELREAVARAAAAGLAREPD